MDDPSPRDFFLEPSCSTQRQYEALRAVFVDGLSQKVAARRFRYSYGAFRLLVHQFRFAHRAGSPPPFSTARPEAAPPGDARADHPSPTSQPSPTPEP